MAGILFLAGCVVLIAALFAFRNTAWVLLITLAMLAAFPFYNDAAYNSCEGGCNIRVDYGLIAPIYLLALVLAVRKLWLMFRNR